MVYRDNQFFEIDKLLSQAQENPLLKGSAKFAQKTSAKEEDGTEEDQEFAG